MADREDNGPPSTQRGGHAVVGYDEDELMHARAEAEMLRHQLATEKTERAKLELRYGKLRSEARGLRAVISEGNIRVEVLRLIQLALSGQSDICFELLSFYGVVLTDRWVERFRAHSQEWQHAVVDTKFNLLGFGASLAPPPSEEAPVSENVAESGRPVDEEDSYDEETTIGLGDGDRQTLVGFTNDRFIPTGEPVTRKRVSTQKPGAPAPAAKPATAINRLPPPPRPASRKGLSETWGYHDRIPDEDQKAIDQARAGKGRKT